MKDLAGKLSLPIHVFGPETHLTAIVGAALGVRPMPQSPSEPHTTGQFLLMPERHTGGAVRKSSSVNVPDNEGTAKKSKLSGTSSNASSNSEVEIMEIDQLKLENGRLASLFEKKTKAIVWGQQQKAIQVRFCLKNKLKLGKKLICDLITWSNIESKFDFCLK